jgi:hypothetical protein
MNWIDVSKEQPSERGHYLVLSDRPYGSWDLTNKKDRYRDHMIFTFWNGNFFEATNVKWWLQVPDKPENFDETVEEANRFDKLPSWERGLRRAGYPETTIEKCRQNRHKNNLD